MLFPNLNTRIENLENELLAEKQVSLAVLRLDTIHPVVSGNKLFKLHYFLQNALQAASPGIVSFGGAYSNHLVATAYACREAGLKSTGVVRGEESAIKSHTLKECMEYGMQLEFISREQYYRKEETHFLSELQHTYKNYLIVPEGGYHPLGAEGAALIMNMVNDSTTHVCCAAGTATTLAGLLLGANKTQQIVGYPVLKNMHDLHQRITYLTKSSYNRQQLQIIEGYHFGGYAKKTPELIEFMNLLYQAHGLPTDFVYTGKMMFGVMDSIKKGMFAKGSKLLCLHTGGLQGNLSLPAGALVF